MPLFKLLLLKKVAVALRIWLKYAIKNVVLDGWQVAAFWRFAPLSLAALLVAAALATPAIARERSTAPQQTLTGVVTRVVDGDTVWIKDAQGTLVKVRLLGMDAPEICQAGGPEARDALKRRVLGRAVTVSFQRRDDYGRTLGRVYLGGEDLGRWMVGTGHAWSYAYRRNPGPYASEQASAKAARLGLFGDDAAQNPRSFRQSHRSCYP